MDFQHDLAVISTELLNQVGIRVPPHWTDYQICMKYLELHQRWFDSSIPYEVAYSRELTAKLPTLTADEQSAILEIERRIKNCETLTPFMSKDIRTLSVKKSDFLLKNWNIYHLHLERSDSGDSFKNPNLLFFQPKGSKVHFIDVKPHPKGSSWFDRDLLNIVYDNWPELLIYMDGCKPLENLPDEEMHDVLKSMVTVVDFRNGMLFPTNLGVAASGDSGLAVRKTDRIFNNLKLWELELEKNANNIRKEIEQTLKVEIKDPLDYVLIVEDGYFVAYEKHSFAKIRLFVVN